MTHSCSVVIVVRDDEARLVAKSLDSLLRVDYPRELLEILVIDTSKAEQAASLIRSFPVTYVRERGKRKSFARNRGIENSRGEILAFTDPDCVVSTGWLRELHKAFQAKDVGVVGGEILPYPGKTPAERYAFRISSHSQQRVIFHPLRSFAHAPNMAFRRDVFQRIGLFDTRFPGGAWEDADLCWRILRNTDLKLGYASRAIVFHRYRTTARAFFMQYVNYGYGMALIRRKYPEAFGQSGPNTSSTNREPSGSPWRSSSAGEFRPWKKGRMTAFQQASFDLLRQAGQRFGFFLGEIAVLASKCPK